MAAFVLLYLVCIALVGIPVLKSELIIGRRGGKSPGESFADFARKEDSSPKWAAVGWVGALSCSSVFAVFSVFDFRLNFDVIYEISNEINDKFWSRATPIN